MSKASMEKEYQKQKGKFRYRARLFSKMYGIPEEEFLSKYNETFVRVWRNGTRTAKFSTVLHSAMKNSEMNVARDIGNKIKRDIPEQPESYAPPDEVFSHFDMLRIQDYPPDTEEIAIRNKEKDDLRQQIASMHANASTFDKELIDRLKQDCYYIESSDRLNKTRLAKAMSCSRDQLDTALRNLQSAAKRKGISFTKVS